MTQGVGQAPHQGVDVVSAGPPLEQAVAIGILAHGRGATAQEILALTEIATAPGVAWLAPQARGNSWYPQRFMAPIAQNEPWLSSGLALLAELVARAEEAGVPAQRVILGGFSQGACLVSEFVARNTRRYGGLIVLSGGLIGPIGTPRNYPGSLDGTPVLVACSDDDPHIPLPRVVETISVMRGLGGRVTEKVYPGMGHTVIADELEHARRLIEGVVNGAA